jgi:hypothetical protein
VEGIQMSGGPPGRGARWKADQVAELERRWESLGDGILGFAIPSPFATVRPAAGFRLHAVAFAFAEPSAGRAVWTDGVGTVAVSFRFEGGGITVPARGAQYAGRSPEEVDRDGWLGREFPGPADMDPAEAAAVVLGGPAGLDVAARARIHREVLAALPLLPIGSTAHPATRIFAVVLAPDGRSGRLVHTLGRSTASTGILLRDGAWGHENGGVEESVTRPPEEGDRDGWITR